MTPNELRIGNYVWYAKDDIIELTHEKIGWFIKIPTLYDPIPLTHEWVKKFGFKISNTVGGFEAWDLKESSFRLLDGKIPPRIGNAVQYVHQLQNLYFSLMGEELTVKELAS